MSSGEMNGGNQSELLVQNEAIRFLVPPENSFWKWDPGGEAICWSDGVTIVFANELSEILAEQVGRGLPPLGAMLLVIAATRESWSRDSWSSADSSAAVQTRRNLVQQILNDRDNSHVGRVFDQLNRINQFAPNLRTTIKAKQVLIDCVFQPTQDRTTPAIADQVMVLLEEQFQGHLDNAANFAPRETASESLVNDLRTLRFRLPKITDDQLALRRSTGLDELPTSIEQELDLELSQREAFRRRLSDWREDPELGAMARAARDLMSVITLRRPMSHADDVAQGGVSDITNRGPLDRLLLSELANDDLTLAVRVAVNESLYLRRESSQRQSQRSRFVVLDSGIRMWGTPRVLATSLAMALGAGLEPTGSLMAYAAQQATLEPVDLATRVGVTGHLATLCSDLHVGQCLSTLQQEVLATDGDCEIVLITSWDAWEDVEFRRKLAESKFESIFVATIERHGKVSIFECSPAGHKLIKSVTVDLDAMAATKPLIDKRRLTGLPAIMSVKPFPLRLPSNGSAVCRWSVGGRGAISISNDHRLQWWDQVAAYGQQLNTEIRPGQVRWVSREPINGRWLAVLGKDGDAARLVSVDLEKLAAAEITLQVKLRPKMGFFFFNGSLYVAEGNKVIELSCETGEQLQIASTDSNIWIADRFFFCHGDWKSFRSIQNGVLFDPISFSTSGHMISHVFESPGIEGPIGVGVDGSVNFSDGTSADYGNCLAGEDLVMQAVSADGRQIRLAKNGSSGEPTLPTATIDVASGQVVSGLNQKFDIDIQRDKLVRSGPIRNRFRAIGIQGDDTITLTSRSGSHWKIACLHSEIRLRKVETDNPQWHSNPMFEAMSKMTGFRFRLGEANWEDGSQAWLDSRGLLHLRSSNVEIPELTIVLSEKPSGGWCSDGNVFGPESFGVATTSSQQVFDEILNAFAKHVVLSC